MASQNPLFARYGFDTEYDTLDAFLKLVLRSYDDDEHQLRICYAKTPYCTIGGIDKFFVVQQTDFENEPKRLIAIDAPGTAIHMSIVDTRVIPNEKLETLELTNERLPFVANDSSISMSSRRYLVHRENEENKYGFCIFRHFVVSEDSHLDLRPLFIDGCVPFGSIWNFGYPSYEDAVLAAKTFLASGQVWTFNLSHKTFKPKKVFIVRCLKDGGKTYALASADFTGEYFLRLVSETGTVDDDLRPNFFYTANLLHIDESTLREKDDGLLKFGDFIIESIVEGSTEHILGTIPDFEEFYGEKTMAQMRKLFAVDIRNMRLFNARQREVQASESTSH